MNDLITLLLIIIAAVAGLYVAYFIFALLIKWPRLLAIHLSNAFGAPEKLNNYRKFFLFGQFVSSLLVFALTYFYSPELFSLFLNALIISAFAILASGFVNDFLFPHIFGGRTLFNPPKLLLFELEMINSSHYLGTKLKYQESLEGIKELRQMMLESFFLFILVYASLAMSIALVVASHVFGLLLLITALVISIVFSNVTLSLPLNVVTEKLRDTKKTKYKETLIDILEEIGDTEAVESLIAALNDENRWIQHKATLVLKKITGNYFGDMYAKPIEVREKWLKWWEQNKETFLEGR